MEASTPFGHADEATESADKRYRFPGPSDGEPVTSCATAIGRSRATRPASASANGDTLPASATPASSARGLTFGVASLYKAYRA